MENGLKFLQPSYLLIGIMVSIAVLCLFWWAGKQNQKKLSQFASDSTIKNLTSGISFMRRRLKKILLAIAIFFLFTALARPYLGYEKRELKRKGIDIVIALDVSKSMLAQDLSPNRLERAKLSIIDFIKELKGDRVGLMLFSGSAFIQCPLTLDYNTFFFNLKAADVGVIPSPGTDIASAIYTAEKTFNRSANKEKILVLLTDGEDLAGDVISSAREMSSRNLRIFCIGVGSSNGNLIPLENSQGKTTYLKDQSGNFVTSKLDEKTLSRIAKISNGAYYPLGLLGDGLQKVYDEHLSKIKKSEFKSKLKKLPKERYQVPIFIALLLLTIEVFIPERARNKPVENLLTHEN